jgi:tetratricopeptide (TPR) repeat protein
MPTPLRSLSSLALVATLLMACSTLGDEPPATHITAMPGLGSSSFKPTARDALARDWFAQGLQLAYAFEHREALRVFRAALARDPSCAICAWGVAYALGPNINNPARGPEREIRRYVALAQQAAAATATSDATSGATSSPITPLEQALIKAMAVRYGRAETQAQQLYEAQGSAMCTSRKTERKVDPQELAYAAAMRDVLQQFPEDPDAVALYADAVMSTLPWDWWDRQTGKPNGEVGEVMARLAATTRQHPQHTGALHFYVHVAEHSPDPRQALIAAEALGTVAPESPHLVHMGSHIYKQVGRFADGSRANEQALAVQKRFDAVLQAQGVQRSGRWDAHHLHFLWYAALMEGRVGLSLRTAREYAQRFGSQAGSAGDYAQLLPWVTLLRLQRWEALLAEPLPAKGGELLQGYAAYARGMAQVHGGRLELAKAELAKLERLLPKLKDATMWGEPVPGKLAKLVQASLSGTIARAEGRHEEAIAQLRIAAELDDRLGNDPPMVGGGARLALAGALLAAGKADEAEREINEALRLNGPSAWTHQGLAQLAELRGKRDEGQRQAALARAAWQAAEEAELPRL